MQFIVKNILFIIKKRHKKSNFDVGNEIIFPFFNI